MIKLGFPYNKNLELLHIPNPDSNEAESDYILQFGTDSEESAINLVKIIQFLKTLNY
jgi:hypothetical protein